MEIGAELDERGMSVSRLVMSSSMRTWRSLGGVEQEQIGERGKCKIKDTRSISVGIWLTRWNDLLWILLLFL